MPRNHQHLRASITRSQDALDPTRRFSDLCLQFEIKDGERAGERRQPYGGRWDRFYTVDEAGRPVGRFVSVWDPERAGWYDPNTGEPSEAVEPRIILVAAQSIEAIEDWAHSLILILGGRRSGKTTGTLAPKILILLLVFAGQPGTVMSPTYRQAKNVWRALIRLAPANWWAEKNKTEHRLVTIHGSTVTLLSADRDDSSRSEGTAWHVNDERQDIGEEPASNAQLSTSEAGGDGRGNALSGSMKTGAHIVIETATIKAELRDHYDKVLSSPKGAVYIMDSYGNPFIDHSFLDDAKEFLDAERIDREIHARWPELVGRVYYPFDEAVHVRDELPGPRDITAPFCAERFDVQARWVVGVDPPHHAVLCKVLDGEILHVRHEVVIGADGKGGDVRALASRCRQLAGDDRGVVVCDPHETHWDDDVRKYFRSESFRVAYMKRVEIEYRVTAVRARFEKSKLFVSSPCIHLRESLRDQTYDPATSRPSKQTKSKITPIYTLDHSPDSLGYAVYKLWPSRVDYESMERAA